MSLIHCSIRSLSIQNIVAEMRDLQNKKRDQVGKILKWVDPPSPSLGMPMSHKILRFILRFGALGAFLVFTEMLTFCDKVMWE